MGGVHKCAFILCRQQPTFFFLLLLLLLLLLRISLEWNATKFPFMQWLSLLFSSFIPHSILTKLLKCKVFSAMQTLLKLSKKYHTNIHRSLCKFLWKCNLDKVLRRNPQMCEFFLLFSMSFTWPIIVVKKDIKSWYELGFEFLFNLVFSQFLCWLIF